MKWASRGELTKATESLSSLLRHVPERHLTIQPLNRIVGIPNGFSNPQLKVWSKSTATTSTARKTQWDVNFQLQVMLTSQNNLHVLSHPMLFAHPLGPCRTCDDTWTMHPLTWGLIHRWPLGGQRNRRRIVSVEIVTASSTTPVILKMGWIVASVSTKKLTFRFKEFRNPTGGQSLVNL